MKQKKELSQLFDQILPCDMDSPFAFISYSSKDSETVWADVCELQSRGYNVWIDKNLNEGDDSWKDGTNGAFQAIDDIDCGLVLFYLSKDSVTSSPCLEELHRREEQRAKGQHGGNIIPLVAIEVSPIDSVISFKEAVHTELQRSDKLSREDKNNKALTATELLESYFPNDDKIRIKSKDDPGRNHDYYQQIEDVLKANGVVSLSAPDLYKRCVDMLSDSALIDAAIRLLNQCSEKNSYLPASLFLAYCYKTGILGIVDESKSQNLVWVCSLTMDASQWLAKGKELKENKDFYEALGFFVGAGISQNNQEGYYEAAQMALNLKMPSKLLVSKCAELSMKLGSVKAKDLYQRISLLTQEDFNKVMVKARGGRNGK